MAKAKDHKLTLIPQHGDQATLNGLPGADMLLEIQEIVAMRVAQLLPDVLKQTASSLFKLSEHAVDLDKRLLYMEAGQLAQYRLGNLPQDFRRHFQRRYLNACRHDPLRRPGALDDFDISQLKIVEDSRLEDMLDAQEVIKCINEYSQDNLHHLTTRFQLLLGMRNMRGQDIPVGPGVVGKSLVDALSDHCSGHAPKERVLHLLTRYLPAPLQTVYRDLLGYIDGELPHKDYLSLPEEDLQHLPAVEPPPHAGTWRSAAPASASAAPPAAPGTEKPEAVSVCTPSTADHPLDAAPPPAPGGQTRAAVAVRDSPPLLADDTAQASPSDGAAAADHARAEVQHRLDRQPLPDGIRHFLSAHWRAWLEVLQLRHGPQGEVWANAVATMDELIESLRPQGTAEARSQMLRRLPTLLRRLDEGFAALNTPTEQRDQFFALLMEIQAETLRVDTRAETPEAHTAKRADLAEDAFPLSNAREVTPAADTSVVAAAAADGAPLAHTQAAPPATPPTGSTTTVDSEARASPPKPAPPAKVAATPAPNPGRLKRGTRIVFRNEDGTKHEAKLAWVSPGGGTYLFTNPSGERALSISAEALHVQLREGRATLIAAASRRHADTPNTPLCAIAKTG